MKLKQVFTLWERRHLDHMLRWIAENWEVFAAQGKPLSFTVTETRRSVEQNSLMWVYLTAWSRQKTWPVNGRLVPLTPDEWKDVLSSAFLREEARIAQGLDGGMVLLGSRTSQFSGKTMTAFLEFIGAAAAQHGVTLDPATEPEPEGRPA